MTYDTVKLGDIAWINSESYSSKENWSFVNYLDTGNITENMVSEIQYIESREEKLPSRARRKVKYNSIIYSTVRPNQKHYGIIKEQPDNFLVSTGFAVIDINTDKASADYVYFVLTQESVIEYLHAIAEQSTSAYPSIKPTDLKNIEIPLPSLEYQKRIASILVALNRKIDINTKINNNLERQVQAVFTNMFGESIGSLGNKSDTLLGDIVESVDNRGKTPPLSAEPTEYPIIDVKALSGISRIIDYNNCAKYVSEDTYNNWFRNGHPKPYDILISTVGSLAEMKIFLGDIGCIAQNVVAFRSKEISPLYLYQYLNYIKKDLIAYNIGSVQPSIKVTHIIKHSIYIPSDNEITAFDSFARSMTEQIFENCQENVVLQQMRDILLPKLMSGEINISNIDI